VEAAERNAGRHRNGRRFDNDGKLFATYIYIISGKLAYETLQSNMPTALPTSSLISKHLQRVNQPVQEGIFRFSELKEFLLARRLPNVVWISEDGTRITSRIEYDPRTNLLVGFVPRLNRNGLPYSDGLEAVSEEAMKQIFANRVKAGTAYVIMAQPLADGAPPFILALFGTDNRFTAEDVAKRWAWMKLEAQKHDITIAGFSSDADSKPLRAMRCMAMPEFCANGDE